MDTITDGEKEVLKTGLANLLQLLFANGKLCGMIRTAVLLVCGSEASVSKDTLTQLAAVLMAAAMFAWSWIEKHDAAAKIKAVAYAAMVQRARLIQQQQMPPFTPAQMPKVSEIKPPVTLLLLALCGLMVGGCMAPVTVNILSSRMVAAYGSNVVSQATEGGAILSSNTLTATLPLK